MSLTTLFVFVSLGFFADVGADDCIKPFTCLEPYLCQKAHGSEFPKSEILFRCDGLGRKICCPPVLKRGSLNITSYPVKHEVQTTSVFPESPEYGKLIVTQAPISLVNGVQATTVPSKMPTRKSKSRDLKKHVKYSLLPGEDVCGFGRTAQADIENAIDKMDLANKVWNGAIAPVGEFPWMVQLYYRLNASKDSFKNFCGGSLINGRYVLTAAHCLKRPESTLHHVRVGVSDTNEKCEGGPSLCPFDVKLESIIPHKDWNSDTLKNDIALLRLERDVLSSENPKVAPICLPFLPDKLKKASNDSYMAAGWGISESSDGRSARFLRNTTLVHSKNCSFCDLSTSPKCPLSNQQLCLLNSRRNDVCHGDSGGPLMSLVPTIYGNQVHQVGVVSFRTSESCGTGDVPNIFTRVDKYLLWILSKIKE